MYEPDVVVIVYPNLFIPKSIIILDPFDHKIKSFEVSSLEEIKQILKDQLPWCVQHHDQPMIHFGEVYIIEWERIAPSDIRIKKLEDLENLKI